MSDSEGSSSFTGREQRFPDAELLPTSGATCQCFRVRLYGKQHFLKQLKPQLATDPRYVAALRKEFETGYTLDHPNLVKYVSRTDDSILMDYVDGETLGDFISRHPDFFRDKTETDRIVSQLLSVVDYLHQHQIIHLDLKPSNILITRIGHDVKLTDLGFCYTDTYTDTGGYTVGYAAPEQKSGATPPDARTDIYAIGKILLQIPHSGRYARIISRCTEESPDKRYSSVAEIERDLSRRHPTLWPWLASLAVVAAALLALVFSRQRAPEPSMSQEVTQTEARADSSHSNASTTLADGQTLTEIQAPATENPASASGNPTSVTEVATSAAGTATPSSALPAAKPSISAGKGSRATSRDFSALRKELRELCRPTFNSQLAIYRDSSYQSMGFIQFNRLSSRFQNTVRPLYMTLWEEKYKSSGLFGEEEYYTECANTSNYYINSLYEDMLRNDETKNPQGHQP